MGDIKRGLDSIAAIYRGQEGINSVYRGNDLIWQPGGSVVTDGLTTFWDISQSTTTNLVDTVGNSTLAATGSVVDGISQGYLGVGGSQGRSAYFQKNYDSGSYSEIYSLGNWSSDGWVYAEAAVNQSSGWITFRGDANSLGWPNGCTDGIRAVISSFEVQCSTAFFVTETWYHFAQCFDTSGNLQIYVNGVLDTNASGFTTRGQGNVTDPISIRIGAITNNQGRNMRIGNFRVYNGKVLTGAEVLQNFEVERSIYGV